MKVLYQMILKIFIIPSIHILIWIVNMPDSYTYICVEYPQAYIGFIQRERPRRLNPFFLNLNLFWGKPLKCFCLIFLTHNDASFCSKSGKKQNRKRNRRTLSSVSSNDVTSAKVNKAENPKSIQMDKENVYVWKKTMKSP